MKKQHSRNFSNSSGIQTAPTDLQEEQKQERVLEADFSRQSLIPEQEYDVELEYHKTSFPVGGDQQLEALVPLRLGYTDEDGKVEILGWGLSVDLREGRDLARTIGRRFLELYSRAIRDDLDEQEEACFEQICNQVDYRKFCRSRELPRFREALLVRKGAEAFISFLDGKNIKIKPELIEQLRILDEGDYFGALFENDADGTIREIKNIVILPLMESEDIEKVFSEEVPSVANGEEIPEKVRQLLQNEGEN